MSNELEAIKKMIEEFYSEVLGESFYCQDVVSSVESLINYNRNLRERDTEVKAFLKERDKIVWEQVNEIRENLEEEMSIGIAMKKIAHLSLKEISEHLGAEDD